MRVIASIACGLVALDCAGKAAGAVPQQLMASDYLWVWWVIAAIWALNTLTVAFRGAP